MNSRDNDDHQENFEGFTIQFPSSNGKLKSEPPVSINRGEIDRSSVDDSQWKPPVGPKVIDPTRRDSLSTTSTANTKSTVMSTSMSEGPRHQVPHRSDDSMPLKVRRASMPHMSPIATKTSWKTSSSTVKDAPPVSRQEPSGSLRSIGSKSSAGSHLSNGSQQAKLSQQQQQPFNGQTSTEIHGSFSRSATTIRHRNYTAARPKEQASFRSQDRYSSHDSNDDASDEEREERRREKVLLDKKKQDADYRRRSHAPSSTSDEEFKTRSGLSKDDSNHSLTISDLDANATGEPQRTVNNHQSYGNNLSSSWNNHSFGNSLSSLESSMRSILKESKYGSPLANEMNSSERRRDRYRHDDPRTTAQPEHYVTPSSQRQGVSFTTTTVIHIDDPAPDRRRRAVFASTPNSQPKLLSNPDDPNLRRSQFRRRQCYEAEDAHRYIAREVQGSRRSYEAEDVRRYVKAPPSLKSNNRDGNERNNIGDPQRAGPVAAPRPLARDPHGHRHLVKSDSDRSNPRGFNTFDMTRRNDEMVLRSMSAPTSSHPMTMQGQDAAAVAGKVGGLKKLWGNSRKTKPEEKVMDHNQMRLAAANAAFAILDKK